MLSLLVSLSFCRGVEKVTVMEAVRGERVCRSQCASVCT